MKTLDQSLKYGAVAICSAWSDWLVFVLMWSCFGDKYLAQMSARSMGGITSFLLNRHWSFRGQRSYWLGTEIRRFLALYAASYAVSLATIYLLADGLKISAYWAKVVADCVCFAVNFTVMKLFIFGQSFSTQGSPALLGARPE